MNESITLTTEQEEAVDRCTSSKKRIFIITGKPGTGKTTLALWILEHYVQDRKQVALCAPTGRAAKRLAQKTGRPARTIHRLLRFNPSEGWGYNADHNLPHDVVVCDESCLHWRQRVLLEDGSWEYIGKIVNGKLPVKVMSLNHSTGELEAKRVTNYIKTLREDPLLVINATRGESRRDGVRILKCTKNHKIATPDGYVKANNLHIGDTIIGRGRFATAYQRSFALGAMLGDASMSATHKGSLSFVHGVKQQDYLKYKAQLFNSQDNCVVASSCGYGDTLKINTILFDNLCAWRDIFYPKGKKVIPRDLVRKYFSEVSLAALYMDDGSINDRMNAIKISTYSFTYDDVLWLCNFFYTQFGYEATPYEAKGKYWGIYLNAYSTRRLLLDTHKHMPISMKYKNPMASAPEPIQYYQTLGHVKIQSITSWEPPKYKKYVYDLEVADNHNYISGNMLVHNSMVDIFLFRRLLEALRDDCLLILSGDPYQLPPVGPGAPFRDLINSMKVPFYELKKIHRQAADNRIILAAHSILEGNWQNISWDGERKDLQLRAFGTEDDPSLIINEIEEELFNVKNIYPDLTYEDTQVLCPQKKGGIGTKVLNQRFQEAFNPASLGKYEYSSTSYKFREGDKIIQMKNNYDLGVFNGDLGRIERVFRDDDPERKKKQKVMKISFDDSGALYNINAGQANELALAYALTIHKSQGSEYPLVIIPCHRSNHWMWTRPLLYTALTRAKQYCLLVGDMDMVTKAIKDTREDLRMTWLKERILA